MRRPRTSASSTPPASATRSATCAASSGPWPRRAWARLPPPVRRWVEVVVRRWVVVAVVVLAAAGGGAWWLLRAKARPDPVATAYLEAWGRKDWPAMQARVDAP